LTIGFAVVAVMLPAVRAARAAEPGTDAWLWMRAILAVYCGFLVANITYDVWLDDFHWVLIGAIVGMAARLPRTDGRTVTDEPGMPRAVVRVSAGTSGR
jgi:hypothetical protein